MFPFGLVPKVEKARNLMQTNAKLSTNVKSACNFNLVHNMLSRKAFQKPPVVAFKFAYPDGADGGLSYE